MRQANRHRSYAGRNNKNTFSGNRAMVCNPHVYPDGLASQDIHKYYMTRGATNE